MTKISLLGIRGCQTMSVTDSGQGPTFFFSNQLGSWKPDGNGDFDFPPNADVARFDYAISFLQNQTQVTGTITLTAFPLQGLGREAPPFFRSPCRFIWGVEEGAAWVVSSHYLNHHDGSRAPVSLSGADQD